MMINKFFFTNRLLGMNRTKKVGFQIWRGKKLQKSASSFSDSAPGTTGDRKNFNI
jgi:hypothetical protein